MFESMVQQQTATSHYITRFLTNLKKVAAEKRNHAFYQARLQLLERYWIKFEEQHSNLLLQKEHVSSSYSTDDIYSKTEEDYLDAKAYLLHHLEGPAAKETLEPSTVGTIPTRLPKLSIPVFSGEHLQWETFRDLFTSVVHEAPHLSSVARLQYLKSLLSGEAAQLISGIPITDANYEGAWRTLMERYDNKGLLMTHYFNHLLSLKPVTVESSAALKKLLDTTNEIRRAFQNLGRPVEFWDDWFVHLTAQKLERSIRKDWETRVGSGNQIPTFQELTTFLTSRVRALDAVSVSMSSSSPTRDKGSHKPLRVHTANTRSSQKCPLCSQSHYLGYCPDFRQKTPLQRKEIVIRLKHCLNCLRTHATNSCSSNNKCFICQDNHHTLLHVDVNADQTPAMNSISSVHVHMQPDKPETSTLLATAIIKVTAPNGHSILVRALLDQGSEATFISEDLAQRLHLQRSKVHIPVTGLGATHCGTVKALVRIQLSPANEDCPPIISAEAYVLPHLTKTFQPRRIDTRSWPHLSSITLSDPGSSSFHKIDFVIGADLYGQILLDGLLKGPPGTPVAQNTIFGWVLSGRVKDVPPDGRRAEVGTYHCSLGIDQFPEASRVLQTRTYKDDILLKAETEERALLLQTQMKGLFTAGGFQLAKWSSHLPELSKNNNSGHVLSDGTVCTELGTLWIKISQQEHFQLYTDRLESNRPISRGNPRFRLRPSQDLNGLLLVGGRLANSHLNYGEKNTLFLSGAGAFTKLLVQDANQWTLHGSPILALSNTSTRFWIIRGRNLVRKIIHRCLPCLHQSTKGETQLLVQLPAARATLSCPFLKSIMLCSSKDRGHKVYKDYIALFVCFPTETIHLEAVNYLSSVVFLAAFILFTFRRGIPSDIFSNQSTTFRRADKEFRNSASESVEQLTSLANNGAQWHFIPPRSPHFGGLWQVDVRPVKHHLRRVIGETTLTFEELSTVLTEIEACLNSRPLTPLSSSSDDFSALTPGHFLIGAPLKWVPEPSLLQKNPNHLTRWKLIQNMQQHFWRRWSMEYLQGLRKTTKWLTQQKNLQVGDLVLLINEGLPPSTWYLGRVTAVFPGPDGLVRVVHVQTAKGKFTRFLSKLAKLPFDRDPT